jgi:outer membrane receptor protein involved in Fe transport
MLDADTYANPASPDYHQMGIDHWEWRAGAFAHAELSPADWVTATFGLRFDYNTSTGEFVSPRLAAVFRPAAGQFVRLGVARSFRKPSFFETDIHPGVRFPEGSPITGSGQEDFLEFMTRVVGNGDLLSESLVSFEAGYLGRFLESRLTLNLDLYCNVTFDRVTFDQNVVVTDQGLPDLDVSSFMYHNQDDRQYTFGLELSARFEVSKQLSLLAWWSHKQVFQGGRDLGDRSPRNLMGLGGRFRTESGLVGSLYAFSRSAFWDPFVDNPAGFLEPRLKYYIDNQVLLLSKLGWRLPVAGDLEVEAGIKLFFPINFAVPHFSIYERGGGVDYQGQAYGGQEFSRVVTAYLQGSY